MSDMSVNKKHNSQVHEAQHVQDTEKAKNTQNTQSSQTDPSKDHSKDWQKFSDSHDKGITAQSVAQKAEEKQNQEKLKASEIQRHLEQQRLGIKA